MEFAGRASETTRVDGYRLPGPSPPHAQMTVHALRWELLKESFHQDMIVAELAELRGLGPEVRRGLRLENAGPLCLCTRDGLQLTTLPHRDTSPVRQGGQLQDISLSRKLCLNEALMTRSGALRLKRRPAKERIEEWYQPPWRDRSGDEEDASFDWARLSKMTFSRVKRKRIAESSASNKKRSLERWSCALCHVNTSSELSFEEHCAGQRHLSNVVHLEWANGTAGLKKIATAESYHSRQHNPWNCIVCQVKCSGELDLKNHLNGRRHQDNVEALWGESKEIEGNSDLQEAKLHEKKAPQPRDKNRRPASRWNCSICKANCTSESDLESHLGGRRHQQNVKAQLLEGNNTSVASYLSGRKHLAILSA